MPPRSQDPPRRFPRTPQKTSTLTDSTAPAQCWARHHRKTGPRAGYTGRGARAHKPRYQGRQQERRNPGTKHPTGCRRDEMQSLRTPRKPSEANTDDTRPRVPPVVLRGWSPTAKLWNGYGELPSDEEPVDEESSTASPEPLPSFGRSVSDSTPPRALISASSTTPLLKHFLHLALESCICTCLSVANHVRNPISHIYHSISQAINNPFDAKGV